MTTSLIYSFIRSLLDDPQADWATDAYLQPHLNLAYRNLEMELGAYGMAADQNVAVIPNLPPGTTDLSSYAAPGGPLAAMWQPLTLYERPAGASDNDWQLLRPSDNLPPLPPRPFCQIWEFRLGAIHLPPASQALDLQVRFEELFPALTDPDQPLRLTGGTHLLAYSTAALVARARGAQDLAMAYAAEAERQRQLLLMRLNRELQGITCRQRPYRSNQLLSTPRLLS